MTLDNLTARLRNFAAARDWEQFHSPKNLVMALSAEVGELTELFQWLTAEQSWNVRERHDAEVLDELADVLIYLVQLADRLDVDLLAAANAKVARNEIRFPAKDAREQLG